MRYVDSIVTPEEQILHRGRLHWTIFLYPSAFLTVFLLPLVRWLTSEAVVTSRRIVIASGLFWRQIFELPLSRFVSIRIEQTLLARLLGFGSVARCAGWGSEGRAAVPNDVSDHHAAEQKGAVDD